MLRNLSIAAISALMIASYKHSSFGASIGVGNPYPVSNYKCQDGTRRVVDGYRSAITEETHR